MTIDLRISHTRNVFSDNDVLQLPQPTTGGITSAAALLWFSEGVNPRDAHFTAAKKAWHSIESSLPFHGLYLLAAHTVAQPDTPFVRHRKLWSSLAARGLSIPGESLGENVLVELGELRSFGVRRIAGAEIESAVRVVHAEPASVLVAIEQRSEPVLRSMIDRGWSSHGRHPSSNLIRDIAPSGGVILWPVGTFDDREAGFAAVATPTVIETMRAGILSNAVRTAQRVPEGSE